MPKLKDPLLAYLKVSQAESRGILFNRGRIPIRVLLVSKLQEGPVLKELELCLDKKTTVVDLILILLQISPGLRRQMTTKFTTELLDQQFDVLVNETKLAVTDTVCNSDIVTIRVKQNVVAMEL